MLITQAADFAWHNNFIDTFPTTLSTPICKFLTFCKQFKDEN